MGNLFCLKNMQIAIYFPRLEIKENFTKRVLKISQWQILYAHNED